MDRVASRPRGRGRGASGTRDRVPLGLGAGEGGAGVQPRRPVPRRVAAPGIPRAGRDAVGRAVGQAPAGAPRRAPDAGPARVVHRDEEAGTAGEEPVTGARGEDAAAPGLVQAPPPAPPRAAVDTDRARASQAHDAGVGHAVVERVTHGRGAPGAGA